MMKNVNIYQHIKHCFDYVEKEEKKINSINFNGVIKPPSIEFQCDAFATYAIDSDASISILSHLMSQDPTYKLLNIMPDQFDLLHPSLTKLTVQFREHSLFEQNIDDFNQLQDEINDAQFYTKIKLLL